MLLWRTIMARSQLVLRSNQERAAGTEKQEFAAALMEKRQHMVNVAFKGFGATDGSRRCELRIGGTVGGFAKAHQVQHDDAALQCTHEERAASFLDRFEVARMWLIVSNFLNQKRPGRNIDRAVKACLFSLLTVQDS